MIISAAPAAAAVTVCNEAENSHRGGYTVSGVVTGKPVSIGGSVGREEATGRGVVSMRSFEVSLDGPGGTQCPDEVIDAEFDVIWGLGARFVPGNSTTLVKVLLSNSGTNCQKLLSSPR